MINFTRLIRFPFIKLGKKLNVRHRIIDTKSRVSSVINVIVRFEIKL